MYHARRDAAGFSNPGGLAVQWCEYTEMHFASFLSGGFTTMAVINTPERKLDKHTSVCIICPLVVIGLTELPNSGWAKGHPAHPLAPSLPCHRLRSTKIITKLLKDHKILIFKVIY